MNSEFAMRSGFGRMSEAAIMQSQVSAFQSRKANGSFADYVAIMRLDHSTKHVFIVLGVVLAVALRSIPDSFQITSVLLGFVSAILIASANYTINEWLDREFDQHHPTKSQRCAVQRELDGSLVFTQWTLLVAAGLTCAALASQTMLVIVAAFAAQGIVYNVAPFRSKDEAFIDVISESINNPLRLMIGWAMIDPHTLPPSSLVLTYWSAGAFLMAAKRLSEYREIVASHGKDLLARYRASFATYSEISLTSSCFLYGLFSIFFLGVFLIKYRIEFILLTPLIIALFVQYLSLAMCPGSSAQRPEILFKERGLMAIVVLLVTSCAVLSIVDLPWLSVLTSQSFIAIE